MLLLLLLLPSPLGLKRRDRELGLSVEEGEDGCLGSAVEEEEEDEDEEGWASCGADNFLVNDFKEEEPAAEAGVAESADAVAVVVVVVVVAGEPEPGNIAGMDTISVRLSPEPRVPSAASDACKWKRWMAVIVEVGW